MTLEEMIKADRHADLVRDHVDKVKTILYNYSSLFWDEDNYGNIIPAMPWYWTEEKYELREKYRSELDELEALGISEEVMGKIAGNAVGYDLMMRDL